MRFSVRAERWPLKRPFAIARETIDTVPMIHLEIADDGAIGRAEAIGVDYRGETAESIALEVSAFLAGRTAAPTREEVAALLHPGGARNAIDTALWDLEAKRAGQPVWRLAGLPEPRPLRTCYTIGLGAPAAMADAVADAPADAPLKVKLGGRDGLDTARVAAIRARAPGADILVDVNQAWSIGELDAHAGPLADLGVLLIEQPLPAGADGLLSRYGGAVPLCADESFDVAADLDRLGAYACVNVKLDKCGGLTAALEIARAAAARGVDLFVGCMLGTSLGMAPTFLLGGLCRYVDLDGPLLLARDRTPALRYDGAMMRPFGPELWG